jgi:hypothetical protein
MALNATTLASAIKAALLADPNTLAQNNASLDAVCTAIAGAVVTHITTNAVVPALGLIAPPGTAGGPVTGSAVVT